MSRVYTFPVLSLAAPRIAASPSAVVQTALGFLREGTKESCTRLCAALCCVTGCGTAVATLVFSFHNPRAAATAAALVGITSALIAAGCVALLTRTPYTTGCEEGIPS
jgi:hypothetical protein